MSNTPFRDLSDPQVRALRELLGVALAASPDLATGETLALGAMIDAELLRRNGTPTAHAPLAAPEVSDPAELASTLEAAIASVRPEVTSTTKWQLVSETIGRALGLCADAVYVTSVGGLSRNITVRLAQSRRAREASIAAVVWTSGTEPLQQALAATTRACLDIPRLTLVFTLDGATVALAAIVTPPWLPAPPILTLAYPGALLVEASQSRAATAS